MRKDALRLFHEDTISTIADRLFQKNGVKQTTMDAIAREADYSKATLYVYFKSKDDIFHFIVLKYMNLLLEQISSAIVTGSNAIEQYKAICRELTTFSHQHPEYYKSLTATIAVDEKSRKSTPVLEEIYQTGESINKRIAVVFEDGKKQGCFSKNIDILPTVFLFLASLSSVIQLANNKTDYIKQRMNMSTDEFLDFSFMQLLKIILKE